MIESSSTIEIATLAGGLTLVPANLHHLARLEALAMTAIAGRAKGRRRVTRTFARKLVNGHLAEWVGSADDPLDCLATQAFTYNGGCLVDPSVVAVAASDDDGIGRRERIAQAVLRGELRGLPPLGYTRKNTTSDASNFGRRQE